MNKQACKKLDAGVLAKLVLCTPLNSPCSAFLKRKRQHSSFISHVELWTSFSTLCRRVYFYPITRCMPLINLSFSLSCILKSLEIKVVVQTCYTLFELDKFTFYQKDSILCFLLRRSSQRLNRRTIHFTVTDVVLSSC